MMVMMTRRILVRVLLLCIFGFLAFGVATYLLWDRYVWRRQVRSTVIKMDASSTELERGNVLLREGRTREAIMAYSNALALRPGWEVAQDNIDIARERLRIQAELDRARARALGNMGDDSNHDGP